MEINKLLVTFVLSFFTFSSVNADLPHTTLVSDDNNTEAEANSEEDFAESSDEFEALFNVTGEDIIKDAMKYLGRPYSRGSAGPKAFDCSGFTSFVFKKNNISLGRSSRDQYTQGISVDHKDLKVGDLVFFTSPGSGRGVGHVGIVSKVENNGNFCFIHAARNGIKVDNYAKTGYYKGRYIGARRILDY